MDRCLDASKEWSRRSKLKGHTFVDEFFFAPVRDEDVIWMVMRNKRRMWKNAYLGIAFAHIYPKKGVSSSRSVYETLDGWIEMGRRRQPTTGAIAMRWPSDYLALITAWPRP